MAPVNFGTAYLLWALGFIGLHGLHRFYLNKVGTGVLWLLTGGVCLIGWIVDAITLPEQVRMHNLLVEQRRSNTYNNPNYTNTNTATSATTGYTPQTRYYNPPATPEKQILNIAKEKGGRVTVSEISMNSNLSLDEAEKYLKEMASKGYAGMDVNDSGIIIYEFYEITGRDDIK